MNYEHHNEGNNFFYQRCLLKDSCGGQIDQNAVKTGKWIENDEIFQSRGQYKNGQREGKWIQVKEIQYNNEQKNQKKIQQNEGLKYDNLICLEGEYCQGKQIGEWKMYFNGGMIGYGSFNDLSKKDGFWREINVNSLNLQNWLLALEGQYKQDKRVGEWKITYKGEKVGGGFYDDKGVKIGQWKDIDIQYYQNYQYISFWGEYKNGIKIGSWKIYLKNNQIGGGYYNNQGLKIGLWEDIDIEYFSEYKQLIFQGEYKNGTKVGTWKINFNNYQIGGGNYDDQGVKIGLWQEIDKQSFNEYNQLTFQGEYKNGYKVGSWKMEILNYLIGEGNYSDQEVKIGQWKDIDIQNFNQYKQITFEGEYKNGIKIGSWQINLKDYKIGGGNYNNEGLKIGYWEDIDLENFNEYDQLTFQGNYKNGIKVGSWKINFYNGQIGGGKYNEKGAKIGQWKDIDTQNFNQYYSYSTVRDEQLIFEGEYKNGIKIGSWIINFNNYKIGGGSYNDQGVKIGYWKDIDIQNFNKDNQVTFQGEYKTGIKIGSWKIYLKNNQIGGGDYNDQGVKIGQWKDIDLENYREYKQLIFQGEYQNGIKVGYWIINFNNYKIGGGSYNDYGVKIGYWKDIDIYNFNEDEQLTFEGEYKNGIKVGSWIINFNNYKIGGGCYNDQGVKIGYWKDIDIEYFSKYKQIIFQGEYKNGTKIGSWQIYLTNDQIVGGNYNDQGVKIGQWKDIDLRNYIYNSNESIYQGEYCNGTRIGNWVNYLFSQ